jgi:hypothetical protein
VTPWDAKAALDPKVKGLIEEGVALLNQLAQASNKSAYAAVAWEEQRVALLPLVVDEILHLVPAAGFEDYNLDALLSEFVSKRTAARAGADDDDESVVVEVEFCHGVLPQLSQSMSLKPRLM